MDKSKQVSFKTLIRCITYNHKPYIKDAMNGFCMQQTTFPFVCAIFDDCSTDEEQKEIKLYLQEHFDLEDKSIVKSEETDDYVLTFARHKDNHNCYFAVYFLRYNHYSIGKHYRKHEYCKDFREQVKYIALCEGDDYWTDPYKLQKQVDYLESHLDCTMACSRTKLYSERDKRFIGENYCYRHNAVVKAKDVINRSGLFISTCSIVYRKSLLEDYPSFCYDCVVGDYPLQIMAAMKGYIYYFNDIMSVYRINNSNSWMSNQSWSSVTESNLNRISSMINMFDGFSQTYLKHRLTFKNKIASYLISQCPSKSDNEGREYYLYKQHFSSYYDAFPVFWKLVDILKSVDVPKVRGAISLSLSYLFRCYSDQRLMYK